MSATGLDAAVLDVIDVMDVMDVTGVGAIRDGDIDPTAVEKMLEPSLRRFLYGEKKKCCELQCNTSSMRKCLAIFSCYSCFV